jgi:tetratricopeptide (TPR) repeat protein
MEALQNALNFTEPESFDYLYLQGLFYLRKGEMLKARMFYENLMVNEKLTLNEKAIVASSLSYINKELNESEKAIAYLVKAAIFDFQSATKETVALTNLAEILYEEGYTEFSLTCVNLALNDANFYGAKHRKVQISNVLPIIESSLLNSKEKQNQLYKTSTAGLVIFVFVLLVLAVIVSKQNNKLKRTKTALDETVKNLRISNIQLSEVNKIKEEYIGHFFGLVSNYIGRMELLKKNILRKITLRQINEIELTVQNIDLVSEREELFTSFDTIFLKLFPNYIDRFNSFFNTDDHIKIENGKAFSPELRIYALKRLGINDNEKIAKFLDYSITTIYTYKTKLKKKLIDPNSNFETALLEIKME